MKFIKIKSTDFENSFSSNEKCLEFLANEKWKDGYICKKCGNTNYCKGKTLFSRRCTKCKHDESATANTMFHRCKVPLNEAFKLAYEVCNLPEVSIAKLSETFERRQMTCWKLKKKIMECLNENQTATS
jgi:hypothetical protein